MTKIVLTFGLIAGAIAAALMWVLMRLVNGGTVNFDNGELFGYTTMIVALSMVFFGVKSYRDRNGGQIAFWKGVQVGLLISLIAAVCYAASWELYYPSIGSEFIQKYTAHYIDKLRSDGTPAAEVEKAQADMDSFGEMYKNPLVRFPITMLEILPVGVIVTLVSAALLRRREVLPAEPVTA
jgi:hypothetical protein